jgi:probable HAF family extracellular repeat protein
MKKIWFLMSMAIFFFIHSPSALEAAPRYSIQNINKPIGGGWANDLNDAGQVALHLGGGGSWGSYLYTPGKGHEYVIFGGISSVNNAGQVVGGAGGYDAYLWSHDLGARALPGINGGISVYAYSINNLGQILGLAGTIDSQLRPVLWNGTQEVIDLTTLPCWSAGLNEGGAEVTLLNDSGLIAGRASFAEKGWNGALFTGTGWINLGGLTTGGGCNPLGLNNIGEVVGYTTGPVWHAFHWFGGEIRDLGALPGFIGSEARGINEAGQIVGFCFQTGEWGGQVNPRAVLWTSEGIVDLNTLVTNLPPNVVLAKALAINNRGQIVATGDYNINSTSSNNILLLTPMQPSFASVLNLLLFD